MKHLYSAHPKKPTWHLLLAKIFFVKAFILLVSFSLYGQIVADKVVVREDNGTTYVVQFYTTVGAPTFTPPAGVTEVDVLVVAGGGGGGGMGSALNWALRGGGGAGGLVFAPGVTVTPGVQLPVIIGNGGAGSSATISEETGNNGQDSWFGDIRALGGGGVPSRGNAPGNDGGSGGGGNTRLSTPGGDGLQPGTNQSNYADLGNDGGDASEVYIQSQINSGWGGGGGGGGAGAAGGNGVSKNAGNGGNGVHQVIINDNTYNFADMFGTSSGQVVSGNVYFAGGGGGSGRDLHGTGGYGGGTAGAVAAQDAMPNTGGGGGGSTGATDNRAKGGDGGSGIVIIRYPISSLSDFATEITGNLIRLESGILPAGKELIINGEARVPAGSDFLNNG